MSAPSRRMPCSSATRRHHVPPHRLTRSVQRAGRLLCWSLAAGMATAATDLLLAPRGDWWRVLWPLPWFLTCAAAVAWACLRAREKAANQDGEEDVPDEWDQAA
ncbi:hypothetical protein [Streptomyces sp. NPDC048188]|uniref:hypothetical protein n=1 Tax=Streptomyces sp. NPDC048188 TaxID=3155749 RepID=UPI00343FC86A